MLCFTLHFSLSFLLANDLKIIVNTCSSKSANISTNMMLSPPRKRLLSHAVAAPHNQRSTDRPTDRHTAYEQQPTSVFVRFNCRAGKLYKSSSQHFNSYFHTHTLTRTHVTGSQQLAFILIIASLAVISLLLLRLFCVAKHVENLLVDMRIQIICDIIAGVAFY